MTHNSDYVDAGAQLSKQQPATPGKTYTFSVWLPPRCLHGIEIKYLINSQQDPRALMGADTKCAVCGNAMHLFLGPMTNRSWDSRGHFPQPDGLEAR